MENFHLIKDNKRIRREGNGFHRKVSPLIPVLSPMTLALQHAIFKKLML